MRSIRINVGEQKLYLLNESGDTEREYPVSTSKNGTGNENGSEKTPLGLHRIKTKIGGAMPANMVLIGREPQGTVEEIIARGDELPADVITSRILWLEGMEPGRNQGGYVDSYNRYIYIHGTNEEDRIGTPASIGCIRMCNDDVIELYRLVEQGTEVLIEA